MENRPDKLPRFCRSIEEAVNSSEPVCKREPNDEEFDSRISTHVHSTMERSKSLYSYNRSLMDAVIKFQHQKRKE